MNPEISPEERELDVLLDSIYMSLKEHSKGEDIDLSICDSLRQIQSRSLFKAPKDDEGEEQFSTYEQFTSWAARELRRRLREECDESQLKTEYKRINESLVYNRLAAVVCGPLPTRRAQLQALEDCPDVKQIPVWELAVKEAGNKKISKPMLHQIARSLGVNISEPAPSASSVLAKAKASWKRLRLEIIDLPAVSSSVDFLKLDSLLVGKRTAPKQASGTDDQQINFPLEVETSDSEIEEAHHAEIQHAGLECPSAPPPAVPVDHCGSITVPELDRAARDVEHVPDAPPNVVIEPVAQHNIAAGNLVDATTHTVQSEAPCRSDQEECSLQPVRSAETAVAPKCPDVEQARDNGSLESAFRPSMATIQSEAVISVSEYTIKFANSRIYHSVAHKLGLRALGFIFSDGLWRFTRQDATDARAALNEAAGRIRDAGVAIQEAA